VEKIAQPTAFVINMGANGLAVARTLGRRGIPVIGVDSQPDAPGFASKYVSKMITEDIVDQPEAVLRDLMRAGNDLKEKGVLIPTSDAALLFLYRYEQRLSEHFLFKVPPERVREAMVNKRLQYEEAKRLNIPQPETFFPTTPKDLDGVVKGVRFPAFIKPLYSHLWFPTFGNKGFIVTDQADLRAKMAEVFASGHEVMVQTILSPTGKDLYLAGAYFGANGYVSPSFCWHKIRQYPPNFGVGSMVESAHQAEVRDLALRFMKGIGYQGVGYVEFKRDWNDGTFKLIEMNARTEISNALQDAAGLPLVLFQYYDLTGQPLPEVCEYAEGVVWWDSLSDIESLWRLRRRGEIKLTQWIRSILQVDVHAYYVLDDPVPLLRRYGFGRGLAMLAGKLIKMRSDDDVIPRKSEGARQLERMSVGLKAGGRGHQTEVDDLHRRGLAP
jgi:D-aspartate ligase